MKEKSFRFRESFGKAVRTMTDKQAGRFIKGLCDNVFDNKYFTTNDKALKSAFILVKTALEADERDRENGRKGGILSAEKRKTGVFGISVVANAGERNCPMEEIMKSMLSGVETAPAADKANE